jgi:hypothetical protein
VVARVLRIVVYIYGLMRVIFIGPIVNQTEIVLTI